MTFMLMIFAGIWFMVGDMLKGSRTGPADILVLVLVAFCSALVWGSFIRWMLMPVPVVGILQ